MYALNYTVNYTRERRIYMKTNALLKGSRMVVALLVAMATVIGLVPALPVQASAATVSEPSNQASYIEKLDNL